MTESLSASQKKGTSSESLEDVRPVNDESHIKVVLTGDKVRAIFVQNPGVEKAYRDLVPDKVESSTTPVFLSSPFYSPMLLFATCFIIAT